MEPDEPPAHAHLAPDTPRSDVAACRRAARQLLARHPSLLIGEADLSALMLQRAADEGAGKPLAQIAHECLALALHAACGDAHDPERIERGYADLWAYLRRIALRRWPADADDITQRALVLIHTRLATCNYPAAFLKFAYYKLLHAAQQERGTRPPPDSLDAEALADALPDPADAAAAAMERIELEALAAAIGRLRDPRQRAAVLLRYLRGLSDQEISAQLGITPEYAAVLRSRALKWLRDDPDLRRALLESERADGPRGSPP